MPEEYKLGDMLKAFPIADFEKALANIDRFDNETVRSEKKQANELEKKAEEVTEKIIEDNL